MSKNVEDAWGDTFDITDTTDAELVDRREHSVNVTDWDGDLRMVVEELMDETGMSRSMLLDQTMRMYLVHLFRECDIEDRREEYGLNTSLPPLDMEFTTIDVAVSDEVADDGHKTKLTMMTSEGVREYLYDLLEDDSFPYEKQTYLVGDAVRWRIGEKAKYLIR